MTVPAEVEEDLKLAPAMFGPLLLDAGLVSGLLLLFVVVVCPISSTVMNPGSETPPPRIRIFSYFYFKTYFIVQQACSSVFMNNQMSYNFIYE